MEKTGDKSIPLREYKAKRKDKRKLWQKEAAEERTYLDDFSGEFKVRHGKV